MFKRIVAIALSFMVLSIVTSTATANHKTDDMVSNNENMTEEVIAETTTTTTEATENMNEEPTEETTPTLSSETAEAEQLLEVVQEENKNFGPDITFTSEYISDGYVMPHAIYTPSTAETSEKIPLIVWLHGSGEVNCSKEIFFQRGLPAVLSEWGLEGFNAYILCPHLTGDFNSGRWNSNTSRNYLQNLIDRFVSDYNVDVNNIIIMGHSLGGQGALYQAHELPVYFSRCVVLSGYIHGTDNKEIDIPTIGYVGKTGFGEDSSSVSYMNNYFVPAFGEDSCFSIDASHGDIPKIAFNLDVNHNNRSDMVEWMFGEMELKDMQIP